MKKRGTISKTIARVSSRFPNTRKLMKAQGRRPCAFVVFECLETLMKLNARVFEIASQSRLRNKGKNGNIHEFFTCCQSITCCH